MLIAFVRRVPYRIKLGELEIELHAATALLEDAMDSATPDVRRTIVSQAADAADIAPTVARVVFQAENYERTVRDLTARILGSVEGYLEVVRDEPSADAGADFYVMARNGRSVGIEILAQSSPITVAQVRRRFMRYRQFGYQNLIVVRAELHGEFSGGLDGGTVRVVRVLGEEDEFALRSALLSMLDIDAVPPATM